MDGIFQFSFLFCIWGMSQQISWKCKKKMLCYDIGGAKFSHSYPEYLQLTGFMHLTDGVSLPYWIESDYGDLRFYLHTYNTVRTYNLYFSAIQSS